jgi:hypothetical protein
MATQVRSIIRGRMNLTRKWCFPSAPLWSTPADVLGSMPISLLYVPESTVVTLRFALGLLQLVSGQSILTVKSRRQSTFWPRSNFLITRLNHRGYLTKINCSVCWTITKLMLMLVTGLVTGLVNNLIFRSCFSLILALLLALIIFSLPQHRPHHINNSGRFTPSPVTSWAMSTETMSIEMNTMIVTSKLSIQFRRLTRKLTAAII